MPGIVAFQYVSDVLYGKNTKRAECIAEELLRTREKCFEAQAVGFDVAGHQVTWIKLERTSDDVKCWTQVCRPRENYPNTNANSNITCAQFIRRIDGTLCIASEHLRETLYLFRK